MKIRKFSTLNNGVYKVSLYTEEWSQADLELMADFGEPEIDLGGSFTGPPAFALPNNLVDIKSESPFTQSFDSRDYVDAADRAVVWKNEICTRIVAVITALRANADDFSKEEIQNV